MQQSEGERKNGWTKQTHGDLLEQIMIEFDKPDEPLTGKVVKEKNGVFNNIASNYLNGRIRGMRKQLAEQGMDLLGV